MTTQAESKSTTSRRTLLTGSAAVAVGPASVFPAVAIPVANSDAEPLELGRQFDELIATR
jgi:hypothetical protein